MFFRRQRRWRLPEFTNVRYPRFGRELQTYGFVDVNTFRSHGYLGQKSDIFSGLLTKKDYKYFFKSFCLYIRLCQQQIQNDCIPKLYSLEIAWCLFLKAANTWCFILKTLLNVKNTSGQRSFCILEQPLKGRLTALISPVFV